MQGKTINGFELKSLLGVGGMAEVWYAENEIGMKAAVKIMSDELSRNAQMRDRFLNEAKVMVKLNHPNIRKVYGYGNIDDRPCIIMEYLDGSDLKAKLKRGQRFSGEQLEKWWNQLADALNYTHQQNVVHRDIKPSNIFIDDQDDVKLLDFGIAKEVGTSSGTMTGTTLGTRIYMSPEQVRDPKRLGAASDSYSLAVSFVHLLTGKAPYDSTTSSDFDIQLSIVSKPLDMNGLPSEWRGFLAPYLEKDPDKRPALRHFVPTPLQASTVDEAILARKVTPSMTDADDETIAEDEAPKTKSQPVKSELKTDAAKPTETPNKPKSKAGLWIGIGVAAVAAVVVLLVFLLKPERKTEEINPDIWAYQEADNTTNVQQQDWQKEEEDTKFQQPSITINANGVSFVMKRVDGGTFQMGGTSEQGSDVASDETPVHSVTVNTFYMGETEVTQALWKAVMGENLSTFKGDNFPMEIMEWDDCQKFINRLNSLTGMKFRLPSEAEWEYAARGGNKSQGYKYAGSNSVGSVAYIRDSESVAVKSYSPNELGLYDMSGNVCELCSDWYDESYYSWSPSDNPQGPSGEREYRVVRGGSWFDETDKDCRVSARGHVFSGQLLWGFDPFCGECYSGIRLVLTN